jgi:membrane-bound lytic murein transglycosylase D
MNRLLVPCILLLLLAPRLATAADTLLPRPAELEPDVQFWIRVYTQVSTNEGLIHDQHRLSVVYETLHFTPEMPSSERARKVDFERERVQDILRHLARGEEPRDDDDKRVRKLWGDDTTPAQLEEAAQDVRFQLGQSDRFRAGLIRSGAWEPHIAEVLANLGLPAEIAALPHVESSFDPYAYSKVGAAGLWQFMRSTGRRFLRIDAAVDERLDPYRETEAAAQLLSYNYRLLGSWPLAITAYNHGAEGVRRARELLGTDDIVRIVRDYHSPSFGFASRNFYVSFLAALSIAQEPEKYFGGVVRDHEFGFRELKMPASASLATLVRALGIDRDTLHGLNPALRPAVWGGQRAIPAGYMLRLPSVGSQWTADLLAQRLGASQAITVAEVAKPAKGAPPVVASATAPAPAPASAAVTLPEVVVAAAVPAAAPAAPAAPTAPSSAPESSQYYVVQAGDTSSTIAEHTGLPVSKLMSLNSMRDQDDIYEGEHLRLVAAAAEPETVTTRANVAAAQAAVKESMEENVAVAAATRQAARTEPVSMAQAQAEGPQLVPGATGPESADPVDYSVAADGTIRIVAAETLGHYADWLGTSAARLRAINHLHGRTPVVMGRRIKLEFADITHDEFESRRRDYHERLQAAYFASHRIAGTEVYIARRGDSLWSITQKSLKVPVWLLQQYNPDLDFRDLRPGTQISLPKVEDVSPL